MGWRAGGGAQQSVGVETARTEQRNMRDIRVFSGTLVAESQYDAAAKVAGRVEQIAVDLGDCVPKGALIARLDNEEHIQALTQAKAEQEVARASLIEAHTALTAAERSLSRVRDLRAQRVASAADLDQAQTEKDSTVARVSLVEAQLQQRESAVRSAEIRLAYTEIRADWEEGSENCRYVAARHADQGAMISANAPIVTLVDLSTLKAVVNVAERDYARLNIGQTADIRVDYLHEGVFQGRVTRMAPVFAEASRQARIEINVPNPQGVLKAGMFARVHIEMRQAEAVLAVPENALIRRGEKRGVFLVEEDSSVRFIALQTGIEGAGWVEALNAHAAGLNAGDEVVTLGHHLLSDGMRVITVSAEGERQTERQQRP